MPHPQVDNPPPDSAASSLNLLGAMNLLPILPNNFSLRFRSACHSGIGMHTPVDVHHNSAEDVRVARNRVLTGDGILTYVDADY